MVKEENENADKCIWTIVAPKGNTINMTFTVFKMSQNFKRTLNDDSNSDDGNILTRYSRQNGMFRPHIPLG